MKDSTLLDAAVAPNAAFAASLLPPHLRLEAVSEPPIALVVDNPLDLAVLVLALTILVLVLRRRWD